MQDWRERISVDPSVCHGKPCIAAVAGQQALQVNPEALPLRQDAEQIIKLPSILFQRARRG